MTRPFLLHHLLLGAADRTPDALALADPKTKMSYAELASASERVASSLAELGVRPGQLVGLSMEKSTAAVAVAYAILRRGAAYVPLDPALPEARTKAMIERAGIELVVADASDTKAVRTVAAATLFEGGASGGADARITDAQLAYVLHTSGSTGVPKGVAISHRNAMAFVEPATEHFGLVPEDRLACHAPLHFDLSVFDLYCAASVGAGVVLMPGFYSAFPKKMAAAIDQFSITVWNSVVSALSLLVQKGSLDQFGLESLRAIIFSGERMPMPLLRSLRARFPAAALYNVYGQTEANSSLVFRVGEVPADDDAALPLGEPLPNFETFVLDDAGDLVDSAGVGELYVRAATVASGGYLRDPERTAEKFVPDPVRPDTGARVYRTGDLVRVDEGGAMFYSGRRDTMVKTRGYRVELSEIEIVLEGTEGVVEVAVIAIPDPTIGNRLVGFVRAAPGASLSENDLQTRIADRLPKYMAPERIEIRAELPRTSSGKIDRKALAETCAR